MPKGPRGTPKGPRSPSLGCPRAAACPRRVSRLPTTDTRERPHAERATCGPERARPRHPQPHHPCTHPVCNNTHATPPSSAAAAHGRSSRPRTHGHRAHGHKAHGHKAHGHCSHGLSAAASKNTSCNNWMRLFPLWVPTGSALSVSAHESNPGDAERLTHTSCRRRITQEHASSKWRQEHQQRQARTHSANLKQT